MSMDGDPGSARRRGRCERRKRSKWRGPHERRAERKRNSAASVASATASMSDKSNMGVTAPHPPGKEGSMQVSDSRKRIIATPGFLYAFVFCMGAIGACLRYLVGLVLPASPLPFSTLAINLVGCYAIYVVYQWFGRRVHLPHAVVRGLGVGLVGAFTTLSAFSAESLALLQAEAYVSFAIYLALTFLGTFCASLLGWATVTKLEHRRMKRLRAQLAHTHETAETAHQQAAAKEDER